MPDDGSVAARADEYPFAVAQRRRGQRRDRLGARRDRQRRRAHRELERRATFDALTGCYNRGAILELLERELAREDGAGIGVIYVDLDKFKPVNDTLGHAAGDELLAGVAERLRELTRREDDVGRLGGDEFLVLLPDIRSSEVAMRVAERICNSMNGRRRRCAAARPS